MAGCVSLRSTMYRRRGSCLTVEARLTAGARVEGAQLWAHERARKAAGSVASAAASRIALTARAAQIVAEVNILRELRHPFIVRYYDRIIDKVRRGAARGAAAPGAFQPSPTLHGLARRRQRSCTS